MADPSLTTYHFSRIMAIANRTPVVVVITGKCQRGITMRELRKRYILLSMAVHPDRGGCQNKSVTKKCIHKISVAFDIPRDYCSTYGGDSTIYGQVVPDSIFFHAA